MQTAIPRFSPTDAHEDIVASLGEAGCAVITGLVDEGERQELRAELAEHLATAEFKTEDDSEDFYPGRTRRVTALVTRSKTAQALILDPRVKNLCDEKLLPNCDRHQLHLTAALEVGPGARAQVLHREEDSFKFFALPRPNLIVATMWAISDFRADNGATLLVPGSHLWPGDRVHTADEVVSAEMPAGSVLLWLGGTLHGAGANVSKDSRYGVILTYSLGWLRQEENQYLDVPLEKAQQLSPELREAIGYPMYDALGVYDPRIALGTDGPPPSTASHRDPS